MEKYLSRVVASTPPSGIRKFFDIAATMPNVISLGIGEPDFVTPEPILAEGKASLTRGETGYTSNSGTLELREALAAHINKLYGVKYDPVNEIVITVGGSEALYLACTAILDPGDEVILPEPCFVSYAPEIRFAGGKVVFVPTSVENGFQVTAGVIEAAITPKTKAILLGYPNNPTGAVMSRENLAQITAVCEKHDLIIISDEIYDQLVYGVEHTCVPSIPGAKDRTILMGGWSKSYAMTGWRLGYACGHPDLLGGMRKVHQYTIMSAPTTAQSAAVVALNSCSEHVEEMRSEYDRRRKLIVNGFNEIGLPCFEPKGAFYAFPSVENTGLTSDEFAWGLLEAEEVAMVPGEAFGASGNGFIRASYATKYEDIERALERIGRYVRSL